jgi:hypothetical protein
MSMVKTQIPDGYATIRTRGLHRSRSQRSENHQTKINRNTNVLKYDSGPLFENNNDLFYKDESLLSSLDALPTTEEQVYVEPIKLKTLTSFKGGRDQFYDNLSQSNEHFDVYAYNLMLPPLKSPQYINELNAIRSHAHEFEIKTNPTNGTAMPLYSRPDSPKYSKIGYRSSTSDSSETGSSSPTYLHHRIPISTINNLNRPKYVNGNENGYSDAVVTSKPPIKTTALQYRKSFSHATKIIYEETSFNRLNSSNGNSTSNNGSCKVNGNYNSKTSVHSDKTNKSDTKISHYHKIHENASSELLNLDTIPKHVLINKVVNGHDRRRYATLGYHQKDRFNNNTTTSLYHLDKSTISLTDDSLFDHYDPLDYKVGCQTMLRSKPVIPWYELAIKKDHRQSCPPFQVYILFFC